MGPRKRSKPNPKAETTASSSSQTQETPAQTPNGASSLPLHDDSAPAKSTLDASQSANQNGNGADTPQPSKPWYGGTWPRGKKATPVTQVAKESISPAAGAAQEAVARARSRTPPLPPTPLKSSPAYKRLGSSSRSLPLAATTTKLHVTSNQSGDRAEDGQDAGAVATASSPDKSRDRSKSSSAEAAQGNSTSAAVAKKHSHIDAKEFDSAAVEQERSARSQAGTNRESAGWLTWFSRTEQAKALKHDALIQNPASAAPDAETGNDPSGPASKTVTPDINTFDAQTTTRLDQPAPPEATTSTSRSWLNLWGNSNTPSKSKPTSLTTDTTKIVTGELESPKGNGSKASEDKNKSSSVNVSKSAESDDQAKSSTWAFWSRDSGSKKSGDDDGELALAGSPSQSKPEADILDEAKGIPKKVEKRQNSRSQEAIDRASNPQSISIGSKECKSDSVTAPKAKGSKDSTAKAKAEVPNLLLPTFEGTYASAGRSGLIQQLARWFPFASPLSSSRHVDKISNTPRIRNALVIGIHGFFPAPFVRSFLGQPTGTSIRFANSAAAAVQKWTQSKGYSCEIEKVALEGEGKIAERVEILWSLLLNWIDKIRRADFVLVACHSQGCPVALMLVAKLIAMGCLSSARIGVCAMAGVNLGPFIDYKTRWIGATALELFDFARQESKVSQEYQAALDTALKFGVKIVYVGSIDDQLVSLESSTFGIVNHPNIYRAVFVDGRVHAPDFLTHLVGFALKLRNLGVADHGLIRELSSPLAGSLYSGEGHSRIYEDEAVYTLAIEHALQTSSLGRVPMQVHDDGAGLSQNPYILPFAMRGLLEEEFVRTELYGEITELIRQFDDWKPSTKVLKDVKFRLEGVRSKL